MPDPYLSEDDLIVLSLAADGESMAAIGRWEKPCDKLVRLGYLSRGDKFNNFITPEGKERWAREEDRELHAIIQLNNLIVEGKEVEDAGPGDDGGVQQPRQ